MARTGEQENKDANAKNAQYAAENEQKANASIDSFNSGLQQLKLKGNLGEVNPWLDQGYLSNVNRLNATAANSATNAAKDQLETANLRTGYNTAATPALLTDLALKKMRFMNEQQAGRATADWDKFQDYQRWLLQSRLGPAGLNAGMFGTATSGRSAALKNLTDFGLASYGPVNQAISGAAAVGAAAVPRFLPKSKPQNG